MPRLLNQLNLSATRSLLQLADQLETERTVERTVCYVAHGSSALTCKQRRLRRTGRRDSATAGGHKISVDRDGQPSPYAGARSLDRAETASVGGSSVADTLNAEEGAETVPERCGGAELARGHAKDTRRTRLPVRRVADSIERSERAARRHPIIKAVWFVMIGAHAARRLPRTQA